MGKPSALLTSLTSPAGCGRCSFHPSRRRTSQLRLDYTAAMQRATADYQMMQPSMRAKVAPLKLPPPPPKPEVAVATIDIPERDLAYPGIKAGVEAALFSNDAVVSR